MSGQQHFTDVLTPEELQKATGKTRAASQASVLAKRGVPFVFQGSAVRLSRPIATAFELLPQQPAATRTTTARPAGGLDMSKVR